MGGSNGTMSGSAGTELVLVGADNGVAVVSSDTPLKRLNYFDGKFLRAEHMRAEQEYLRFLVRTSNRAGGSGIVNGFDTVLAGGGASVTVGQGLALDAEGRVLLLSGAKTLKLDDIIAASSAVAPGSMATAAGSADFADCVVTSAPTVTTSGQTADLYLLTVGFLEALCGEEDVFGKLCEAACVQSKDRPWRMEGVLFRAVPLLLKALPQVSKSVPVRPNQFRSRVASAYFADERAAIASLISGVNIKGSDVWCLGAGAEIGNAVPLAVFSRSGGNTHFLDAWTARREHIETPARRYWAWRLSMRPWDVFLAQVLQFQCQLHEILSGLVDGGPGSDPCAPKTVAIGKATDLLDKLEIWHKELTTVLTPELALKVRPFDITAITGLKSDLGKLTIPTPPSTRILIDGGILELPSAGYLPINVGGSTVNQQVRNFMGPGVDLRFCVCRPDFIPHVLEEAQHMERISLLDGIDDPKRMPHVDIFVPNGETAKTVDQTSRYFDLFLIEPTHFPSLFGTRVAPTELPRPLEEGAARWAPFGNGGQQFYWAGTNRRFLDAGGAPPDGPAGWIEVTLDRDPFALTGPSQFASIYARFIDLASGPHISVRLSNLRFTADGPATAPTPADFVIKGLLEGTSVYAEQPSLGLPGGLKKVPIQLRRHTDTKGGQITVELPDLPLLGTLIWDWTAGSALTGLLHLKNPAGVDIKLLEVQEDPDAQNPSNKFHSLSERAIPALQEKFLAGLLKDTGFATYAEQALFPPPDPKSSLDFVATLDWVLFARRRECSCDREAFAPPVADKKFQVYWVDADKGLDVLKFLPSNNSTDIGNVMNLVKPIDVVSYPGTSSALRDASVAVAEAKTKLGENTVLRGGLIGQQPPQDDDALEQARLQSYATALQGFMSLKVGSEFKTIPFMPPAFIDPNVSGAILIGVSKPPVREELVFRVSPESATAFLRQIKQVIAGSAKVSTLTESFAPGGLALSRFVGVARFKPGESALQPGPDDLATRWTLAGGGDVLEADAIFDPSETDALATVAARTDSIDSRIGVAPPSRPSPSKLPSGTWDLTPSMNPALAKATSALFLVAKAPVVARVDRVIAIRNSSVAEPTGFVTFVNVNHGLPSTDFRYDATQRVGFTDNVGKTDDATKLVTELKTPAALQALRAAPGQLQFSLVALITRRTDDPAGRDTRIDWILNELITGNMANSTGTKKVTVADKDFRAETGFPLGDLTNDLLVLVIG